MALAWALSVALVNHWERTVALLESNLAPQSSLSSQLSSLPLRSLQTLPQQPQPHFSRFVHNKAIQKARESFRITPARKEYLSTLKIK
jgi:hypothetical protein